LEQRALLKGLLQYVYEIDGRIKQRKGDYEGARLRYKEAFEEARQSSDLVGSSQVCASVSTLFAQQNKRDSAVFYAVKGFEYGTAVRYRKGIMRNGSLLAELFDSTRPSLALHYFKVAAAARDSLYGLSSTQAIQNLVAREEAKQKEMEEAKMAYRNKLRLYGLVAGLAALLIMAA